VWAGIECTVNRVGDRTFDQLVRSGHQHRLDDLDRIAGLGVRTLRYPVLWERQVAAGWAWTDLRLHRLRALGIAPIAGLVHHGSGPLDTSLVDDAFPARLAAYAEAVARRYPWIDAYTPVNEPLTTARFSGLYGHWYPHGKSDRTFVRALLIECRAVALAMAAIRRITPGARLVQTEDLAYVRASPALQYQADFENERRWLTFDLLAGRVDGRHPMRAWLRGVGATDAELDWFRRDPCVVDLVGLNYYVTSERYLDDDLRAWPPHTHGGNGRHAYADVEAVRAIGIAGAGELLRQAWARTGGELAITEVHLGCTREEQVRWLVEVWDAATEAAAGGVPVRAICPWALFGAYDWHCLVTRDEGRYEPGGFDVRGPWPRETALGAAIRELAHGRRPAHPALVGTPWWRRAAPVREEAA
jgi:dTDP-4-dehydrorhamnose reductase